MQLNFINWSNTYLKHQLGLVKVRECKVLDDWLALGSQQLLTDFEQTYLGWLFDNILPFIDNWNEAELRDQFVSNITSLVNFNSAEYELGVFAERTLSAQIGEFTLSGKVDWMVASEEDKPLYPYFFIHEYKQEEGNSSVSGKAQLIATMRAAQALNEDKDQPIYGCYVLGRFWFLAALIGQTYCIKDFYTVTQLAELFEIVKMLKAQKAMIIKSIIAESKLGSAI